MIPDGGAQAPDLRLIDPTGVSRPSRPGRERPHLRGRWLSQLSRRGMGQGVLVVVVAVSSVLRSR